MQKILQSAYPQPKGMEANWYRSISGNALVPAGPVPFDLSAMWLPYYCNGKTSELLPETDNWFYVWSNHLSWFAEPVSYYTIRKQQVYLLTERDGELWGLPLYKGIHNGNANTGITNSRALIITRDGNSPYVPVTRKQFLTGVIKFYEFQLSKTIAAIEKNLVSEAAEKEDATSKARKFCDDQLKPARDYLSDHSDEDLDLPAIVDDPGSFKKFGTIEKGGRELVRINPDYFNTKLPNYMPQFMVVYWRWDNHASGLALKKELEDHFNWKAIKDMIDK